MLSFFSTVGVNQLIITSYLSFKTNNYDGDLDEHMISFNKFKFQKLACPQKKPDERSQPLFGLEKDRLLNHG